MKIKLYTPFAHQRALHDVITNHVGTVARGTDEYQRVISVVSPRQVGKTVAIINELIRIAYTFAGGTSIYITPSLGQARKVFRKITSSAYKLIKNSNSTNLFIEFSNGSIIYFNSAVQGDDIRGMTVEKGILVIDEAAYIDSDFYNEVCTPFVDFHKELTVLVSTPEYRQGFFYENYMASLGTPYSINFSDYDLGVIRSHERLEGIRQQVPLSTYKSQYLGLFKDNESNVFGYFSNAVVKYRPGFESVYLGLDFGTGSGGDYTVLTGINEKGEMCCKWRWNDIPPSEQISRIIAIYNGMRGKVKGFMAEQNSIGAVYIDMLRKGGIQVTSFVTTSESKRKLVDKLKVAFEQDKIRIWNDADLLNELSLYEQTVNPKNNSVSYNAPANHHDDCVISLMLAWECMSRYKNGMTTSLRIM